MEVIRVTGNRPAQQNDNNQAENTKTFHFCIPPEIGSNDVKMAHSK